MTTDHSSRLAPPAREGLIHEETTRPIIGTFFDVFNETGYGFLESAYRDCLAIALRGLGMTVQVEAPMPLYFRAQLVSRFRCDLLIENKVIVEVKSCHKVDPVHERQLLHYLRVSKTRVGLLLNFGPKAQFKRVVL